MEIKDAALPSPGMGERVDDQQVVLGFLTQVNEFDVPVGGKRRIKDRYVIVGQVGVEFATAAFGVDQGDLAARDQPLGNQQGGVGFSRPRGAA